MIDAALSLGQASPGTGTDVAQVLLVLAGLLVVVGVGTAVVFRLRKGLLGREDAGGEALTLHDIRQLHARGAMSDEEFQRAKQAMLGAAAARRTPSAPPNSERPRG